MSLPHERTALLSSAARSIGKAGSGQGQGRRSAALQLRTTLVVPALHCPSCVEHITSLLARSVSDVSVSLLDSTVQFSLAAHAPDDQPHFDRTHVLALLAQICATLDADGYPAAALQTREVAARGRPSAGAHSITLEDVQREAEQHAGTGSAPSSFPPSRAFLRPLTYRREQRSTAAEHEEARQRHMSVCAACRGDEEDEQQEADTPLKATLAIGGMTCASCVGAINSAAQALNAGDHKLLHAFSVELLSNSASATVQSRAALDQLVEAIEDAGYDASIATLAPVGEDRKWTAQYSIGGMTCASCVGNVERAVRSAVELSTFEVALLEGRASAAFSSADEAAARKVADSVLEAIDDAGYEVQLSSLDPDVAPATQVRAARVSIQGMFCGHCVSKVQRYFERKRDDGSISIDAKELAALRTDLPELAFTYTPSASTTLRSIISDLASLDPAFDVVHVTPPSLASRSAELARREFLDYALRLTVALLFAVPTFVVGMLAPALDESAPLRQRLAAPAWGGATVAEVTLCALATPVQFGVGSLFYVRSYKSLRSVWRPGRSWSERLLRWGNMEVLVAVGTSVAYFASFAFMLFNVARGPQEQMSDAMTFFDASVFLITFILLGRLLESWSKRRTGDAVAALGALRPSRGLLLLDPAAGSASKLRELDVALLELGDLVLVPAGASPPLDSTLADERTALFDESSLTGESVPAKKQAGDQLFAGTANASAHPVIARVSALPGEQLLDGILDVVRSASGRKASIERIADRVTSVFVPVVIYIAIGVLLLWLVVLYVVASPRWVHAHTPHPDEPGARFLYALQFAISVVVVACPCGIGLAAPTAQLAGIGLASARGILVNGGGEAFQQASQAGRRRTVFVFDKTGTLTEGVGQVVERLDVSVDESIDIWHALDIVEQSSTHPVGEAIRRYCEEMSTGGDASALRPSEVQELAGSGLVGRFDGFDLLVGNRRLMTECAPLEAEHQEVIAQWQSQARSAVFVAVRREGQAPRMLCALAVADPLRTEAAATIAALRKRYGAECWIVSGDAEATVRAVAAQLDIDHVVAGVLPTGKQDALEHIRNGDEEAVRGSEKPLVIFIGDGINDAPALTSADVGVAMGGGSAIASSSADFILLSPTAPLASLPVLLSLSRATARKVRQNFAWAACFNLTLLPIAAGALAPTDFTLGPSWSGLAMALSSTSVVLNALTLRLWRPES